MKIVSCIPILIYTVISSCLLITADFESDTIEPTSEPTNHPTYLPTHHPTASHHSHEPTSHSTHHQTHEPTLLVHKEYSHEPTHHPSHHSQEPSHHSTHEPTEYRTHSPSGIPTNHPSHTNHPTSTPIPGPPFSEIINGGFEHDNRTVTAHGGTYFTVPFGFHASHQTYLNEYVVDQAYYQTGSGMIYLIISAENGGFLSQNITSCPDLEITLTFTAASLYCDNCVEVGFDILADHVVIHSQETSPFAWTAYSVSFMAPAYYFTLAFHPHMHHSAKLLLDNLKLDYGRATCPPTSAPTWSPTTYVPSGRPTAAPTTSAPSTSFPTGIGIMFTIAGVLQLQYISYAQTLTEVDLNILSTLIERIVARGAHHMHVLTGIQSISAHRLDDKDVAVDFVVDVMKGQLHTVDGDMYEKVFNATREYLLHATVSGAFVKTLGEELTLYHSNSNTTLDVSEMSGAVLVSYGLAPDTTHDSEVSIKSAVWSVVIIIISIAALMAVVNNCKGKPPIKTREDSSHELLQEFEMSEPGTSVAGGRHHNESMTSSVHNLIHRGEFVNGNP